MIGGEPREALVEPVTGGGAGWLHVPEPTFTLSIDPEPVFRIRIRFSQIRTQDIFQSVSRSYYNPDPDRDPREEEKTLVDFLFQSFKCLIKKIVR